MQNQVGVSLIKRIRCYEEKIWNDQRCTVKLSLPLYHFEIKLFLRFYRSYRCMCFVVGRVAFRVG
jgi:hypothetical protein